MALILIFSSCNSKKNLLEDESFLASNKIKIKSDYPIHSKSELNELLVSLYRQGQTKYSLGFPRHVFYYRYKNKLQKKPDKKPWDDERIIKNRPVLYDSLKAGQTTTDMEKYLSIRGYRSASVNFEAKTKNKETDVTYFINPGPRIYFDTLIIIAEDSTIQQIVDQAAEPSLIQKGTPLDIQRYNQEKLRIVRLLQNEGYATFDESYIPPLEADSSGHQLTVIMRLHNPSDSTFHQKYRVGNIHIYPDYSTVTQPIFHDTLINKIYYFIPDTNLLTLKPEAIQRHLFLKPGEYTRIDNLERTRKNLGRIELIKFVSLSAFIDTTLFDSPAIDYTFYLTRNKKINFDIIGELTYSTVATASRRSLFGTSFSTNYRDRNIFHNAEVFNINAELGFEFNFFNKTDGDTTSNSLLNSLNAGLETGLSFRRFMDPLNIYKMIGYTKNPERTPLFGARLRKWFLEDASSNLNMGFNYVIITDLYDYYNFNANLSYSIQPDPYKNLTITRIGFDLFVPTAQPAYQSILDNNKFLAESFGNQLFTGLLFRNYLFEVNSKVKAKTGHFKLIHSAELSGIEMYAINSIVNIINNNNKEIVLNPGGDEANVIEFSQFVKGEVDLRYLKDLSRQTSFAIRFNTGVATPYGPYTAQVPYPKQFYVGGPLSNRAWQIRQLGPGSFEDTTPIDPNVPYYQTGDFKLDMSAELRFKLFWYFDGVLFVDAANVWILQNDPTRVGAQLSWNFFDELGIGYGYGIRLDLDFFILRLDLGYKLHSPFDVDGSKWLKQTFPSLPEPQFAIGLPF